MSAVVQIPTLGRTTQYDLPDDIFIQERSGSQPVTATAELTMYANGSIDTSGFAIGDLFSQYPSGNKWTHKPRIDVSLYVYANIVSGSMTSGSFNSWLSLDTARTWTLENNFGGSEIGVVNFRISTESDGSRVVYDANTTFEAVITDFGA